MVQQTKKYDPHATVSSKKVLLVRPIADYKIKPALFVGGATSFEVEADVDDSTITHHQGLSGSSTLLNDVSTGSATWSGTIDYNEVVYSIGAKLLRVASEKDMLLGFHVIDTSVIASSDTRDSKGAKVTPGWMRSDYYVGKVLPSSKSYDFTGSNPIEQSADIKFTKVFFDIWVSPIADVPADDGSGMVSVDWTQLTDTKPRGDVFDDEFDKAWHNDADDSHYGHKGDSKKVATEAIQQASLHALLHDNTHVDEVDESQSPILQENKKD